MASYSDVSTVSGPDWLVGLTDELLTSDFVHEAHRRAWLQHVIDAAPSTTTDDPGGSQLTADFKLTMRKVPPRTPATDDAMTIHDVCREFTLHVLGHHVGTWLVCHTVSTTTDLPVTTSVRLVVTSPTIPPGEGPPPWLREVARTAVTADFVQSALVGALLDALMEAGSRQTVDDPSGFSVDAGVRLKSQPMAPPATDSSSGSDCVEHGLTIGGVHLYHWQVCTQTLDSTPGTPGPAPAPTVHLEARHPHHPH